MKNISNCIISVLGFLLLPYLAWGNDYDFRNSKWGMSRQEVRASESLKTAHEAEDVLVYKTQVLEKNVDVIYVFVQDKLVRTKYALAERHTNNNDFISDYMDFKNILTKKYGQCKNDRTIWKKDLYKNDPDHWGMAIAVGDLAYFSQWETDRTYINCMLWGDNFDVQCGVEYSSKELKHLEVREKERKALDKF